MFSVTDHNIDGHQNSHKNISNFYRKYQISSLIGAVGAITIVMFVYSLFAHNKNELSKWHSNAAQARASSVETAIKDRIQYLRDLAEDLPFPVDMANEERTVSMGTDATNKGFAFLGWAPLFDRTGDGLSEHRNSETMSADFVPRVLTSEGQIQHADLGSVAFPITDVLGNAVGYNFRGIDPVSRYLGDRPVQGTWIGEFAIGPNIKIPGMDDDYALMAIAVRNIDDIHTPTINDADRTSGYIVGVINISNILTEVFSKHPDFNYQLSDSKFEYYNKSKQFSQNRPDINYLHKMDSSFNGEIGSMFRKISNIAIFSTNWILVDKPRSDLIFDSVYQPILTFGAISSIGLLIVFQILRFNEQKQYALEQSTAELRQANIALDEYREFTRVMLDSVQDAIVACDETGKLKVFNRKTMEFHGLPAEPIPVEQWASYYSLYCADGVTPMAMEDIPLFRALKGDVIQNEEMTIRPNECAPIQLLASGRALTGADGRKIGAFISMHDVTEQRASEAARKVAEDALRHSQRMEAIGKLTGGIAHDFNNLLGIVLGNLQLLQLQIGDNVKAAARIETALKATVRGNQLTRRLLGFSSQEAMPGTPTDANAVLGELEDILARSLTSEIELKFHAEPDLWLTDIDPGGLQDAVLNLSLNARDAMPEGGHLVIETSNRRIGSTQSEVEPRGTSPAPGEYVVVSVSDNGTGMAPAVLDKAFEPFFTTKSTDRGSGLGLSMVYGFAKRSKGDVRIYSEVGHGTTVRLFLPRSAETQGVAPAPVERSDESCPRGTETVLLVDDEPDLLEVADLMLTELGYRTVTAGTGAEALGIVADRNSPTFDLVFSDVIMPGGVNGFELAQKVAEISPSTKVLLASGFTGQMAHQNYGPSLSQAIIHKPYDKHTLARAVSRVIRNGAMNRTAIPQS